MTGHRTIECLRRYIPNLFRDINLRASAARVESSRQTNLPPPIPIGAINLDDLPNEDPPLYFGIDSDGDTDTEPDDAPAPTTPRPRNPPTKRTTPTRKADRKRVLTRTD